MFMRESSPGPAEITGGREKRGLLKTLSHREGVVFKQRHWPEASKHSPSLALIPFTYTLSPLETTRGEEIPVAKYGFSGEVIWKYPLKKKAPKKLREKTERKKINLLIKIFPLKVIYQEEKGENEKKKVRVGLGKEGKGLAHNRKKAH